MRKRVSSIVLVICIIASFLTMFPVTVSAAAGGKCGDNVYWSYDDNGALNISGSGKMTDWYSDGSNAPWRQYREKIKSITIGEGVTYIGKSSFRNFLYVETVNLPNSLTQIGDSAFFQCNHGLKEITIPKNVTNIGKYCFYFCWELKKISIPEKLTNIGYEAFSCTGIEEFYVDENNILYSSLDGNLYSKDKKILINYAIGKNASQFTIPDCVITISEGAFKGSEYLISVNISKNVKTIGSGAFSGSYNLEYINIPDSVATIDSNAFENTKWEELQPNGVVYAGKVALKYKGDEYECDPSIVIKDGTKSISNNAFFNCWGLTSISLPDSLISIGDYAFAQTGLNSINLPNGITNIGCGAFMSTPLENITIPQGITKISDCLFNQSSITNVNLPNSILSIGSGAFEHCSSLESIKLPENLVSIGDGAFHSAGISNVIIPDSVKRIEEAAFATCHNLNKVILGSGLVYIGNGAFSSCEGLTSITIPTNVTHIGDDAFSYCTGISNIKVDADNKNYSNDNRGALFDKKKTTLIFYPLANTETSYIVPSSVTTISARAFYNCKNALNITLGNKIKNIGLSAFSCKINNVYYYGTEDDWKNIAIESGNTNLLNATIHYDEVSTEKHDITVEVRDAATNKLIPDSSVYICKNADNAKFYTLTNGRLTIKDVEFPIYQMGVNAWGYDFHKSYSNISYPETGKIVFAMVSKESQKVPAQGVTIFNKIDKLNVGETHQLEAWVTPLNASDKSITWSSSDTSIATVDSNGLVTAKWNGTTKIIAKTKNGDFKDSVNITISNGAILTSFNNIAYSFENQSKKIPLKIYQNVYGEFAGILEYNRDKSKGTGGVCAGMVNTSLMFLNDYRKYTDYGGNNIRQLSFSNEKVKNFIWFMYLSQNKTPFSIAKLINGTYHNPSYPEYDNIQSINRLIDYAQKEPLYISVGNESGGHALLSFGVTLHSQYNSKNCSLLWIYDCNFPDDANNFIAIYKNTDGSYNGEWEYVGYDYPFNSQQTHSRLSFVRYDDIISAAKTGSIQLMSLDEEAISEITFVQNSSNLLLMDSNDKKLSVENGIIYESNIQNYTYFDDYYIDNKSNRIVVPNGKYEVQGSNVEDNVETTIYTSSDSISTITSNNAEITFDIRDVSTEGINTDNYVNINNNSIAGDYSIKYMPFNSVYGYNYDSLTVLGNTDGIVNTYEKKGNIYVSGVDKFGVSATIGNETVTTAANNLNADTEYCIKVETADGTTTIQVTSEDAEITDKLIIPERTKVSQPLYDVESGNYSEKQVLTLTPCNETTCLYYTTDGTEPYEDISMLYTEPISVDQSMTVKVLSTQYGCEDSDILTLDYTLPNVTVPVPSLPSGEYKGIQQIELTAEDDANIYYTIDGTDPMENGELYTCPIILTTDTTLKAYAEINGCVSDVCEYEYTISDVGDCSIDDIIVANEMVKVNITTNKNESGVLVVACYSKEGRLLDVNYCDITLDSNISNSRLIDINTTSATTVSAFLWNNWDSLTPLCNNFNKTIAE